MMNLSLTRCDIGPLRFFLDSSAGILPGFAIHLMSEVWRTSSPTLYMGSLLYVGGTRPGFALSAFCFSWAESQEVAA